MNVLQLHYCLAMIACFTCKGVQESVKMQLKLCVKSALLSVTFADIAEHTLLYFLSHYPDKMYT